MLAGILVSIPVIFLSLRIQFKRTYHRIFLAFSFGLFSFAFCTLHTQGAIVAFMTEMGEWFSRPTGRPRL